MTSPSDYKLLRWQFWQLPAACPGKVAQRGFAATVFGTSPRSRSGRSRATGGASVTKYSKDDRELVVVNGMPTSGLLTSQVVVLGRAARIPEYRVILKSAVFMGDVKVRQEKDGLTADAKGKAVFYVPFELASLVVHTGL